MNDPSDPPIADVCMMLEGTFPYVQGGVSSWVSQTLREMSDVRFALFYIGSRRDLTPKRFYEIPDNVVHLEEVFIFEMPSDEEQTPAKLPKKFSQEFYGSLERFYLGSDIPSRLKAFWEVIDHLDAVDNQVTFGNLCQDHEAWELLCEVYRKYAKDESFIDFFWSTRFMHLPTWMLLKARARVPKARVYHAISTGYAGLAGAIAAHKHRKPYFVSEHGIYTKERIAEISQASWIHEKEQDYFNFRGGLGVFKKMWIELFAFQGHVTYHASDLIISLFQGNSKLQIEYGAPDDRLDVIPNGIHPEKFDEPRAKWLARRAERKSPIVIGFVGRVVQIKDVKTLIRAANSVARKYPDAQFLLAGPTEEDPDYYEECLEMVKLFKLEKSVEFLGRQNVMEFLPTIDVMVLTSISEGLPLVIIEGFAVGIPVVSTDVGACRELIYGRTPEDKKIGAAGVLTKISSPDDTATALATFCDNPENVDRMGQAGRTRVEKYYVQRDIMNRYRDLYFDTSWSPRSTEFPEDRQALASPPPAEAAIA